MSAICISPDYFILNPAIGVDADKIKEQFEEIVNNNDETISLRHQIAKEVIQKLNNIYEDCSQPNWDGYGAKPIDIETYYESQRFINCLPESLPYPEVTPDPDGEVSFEWFKNSKRIFSVSIGRNGELSYAGLYGIIKAHGAEFLGDELPKTILENIQRVFI